MNVTEYDLWFEVQERTTSHGWIPTGVTADSEVEADALRAEAEEADNERTFRVRKVRGQA